VYKLIKIHFFVTTVFPFSTFPSHSTVETFPVHFFRYPFAGEQNFLFDNSVNKTQKDPVNGQFHIAFFVKRHGF
jgi:hypothetical protein